MRVNKGVLHKGPFINYVEKGGLVKCQQYYISLCSKHVKEGEGGIKNPQNPVNVGYE